MFTEVNSLVIVVLIIINLSSGCSTPSRPIAESTSTTAVGIIPTATLSAIPTHPNPSTATMPTPSEAESKAIALNLLENNGGCRLPCIWGLTPGTTTSVERQKILASYGEFSEPDFSMSGSGSDLSENPGGVGIAVIRDNVRISMGLVYYETDNLIETLSLVTTPQQDQKYVFGNKDYLDLVAYYTLLAGSGLMLDLLMH